MNIFPLFTILLKFRSISVNDSFPLHYFRFRFITVLACISVSITVIVNGFDLFQLTDISVFVN